LDAYSKLADVGRTRCARVGIADADRELLRRFTVARREVKAKVYGVPVAR
jgi:hypothetical protein